MLPSMLPLRAGTQISEVGWCKAAFVGTEAKKGPRPLPLRTACPLTSLHPS